MLKISIVFLAIFVFTTHTYPASDENKLDKATSNDVSVNLVTPKATTTAQQSEERQNIEPVVSVTSTGTIGITSPSGGGDSGAPPSKFRPGNMFARFIDDVFQIPITVLHSVTKLLTNPFTQRHKDGDST